MTLAPDRQQLPESSQAAKAARMWVREAMTQLGREDLVESAELCVSELVTNALLHAQPPFDVRIAGTPEEPIIGVHDGSVFAPKLTVTRDPSGDDSYNTFGRGLSIVASYSANCGSTVDEDGRGKTVWFSPKAEPTTIEHPEVFDVGDLLAELEQSDWCDVQLVNMPMAKFLVLSQRFEEFNRDLQVLAHNSDDVNPAVVEFTKVVAMVREDLRMAVGNEIMWEAMTSGSGAGNFSLGVTPALAEHAERMLRLMSTLLNSPGQHTVLSARLSDEDLRLQVWYFEQFINQIRGAAPESWVEDPALVTRPAMIELRSSDQVRGKFFREHLKRLRKRTPILTPDALVPAPLVG